MNPLFLPENLDRAAGLVGTLRAVAEAHDATPAQIALAWVIRHPNVAAIPGAASVEQVEHNVAAADIVLKEEEARALTVAAEEFRPISGAPAYARLLRGRLQEHRGR